MDIIIMIDGFGTTWNGVQPGGMAQNAFTDPNYSSSNVTITVTQNGCTCNSIVSINCQ